MEAGRAISRGFVTPDKTTVIASTHRDYAIGEKSDLADGRADADTVQKALEKHARSVIQFNMAACAEQAGCALSAVLFGALACSSVLPFPRSSYEDVISNTGRAVEANLKGFALGFDAAEMTVEQSTESLKQDPLITKILREFPHQCHDMVIAGAQRLSDYQDRRYVEDYIAHLRPILKTDDKALNYALTREMAAAVARWMSYEDIIRVADLKTRKARFQRIRQEAKATNGQIIETVDYLHPRMEEIRDLMPRILGQWIDHSSILQKILQRIFHKGRHIHTHHISGFLFLRLFAMMRPFRRWTYRHHREAKMLHDWCIQILNTSSEDYALALELARAQALVKGYGDTHERSFAKFKRILDRLETIKKASHSAEVTATLIEAATADEEGKTLEDRLEELEK
jgi:indolepyruvate ferredoxin oxidoreductase beta subunit